MNMDYPHFLYDPVSLTYVSIDTVQQLSRTSSNISTRYTQCSTGQRKQISIKDLSSASFECTWFSYNKNIEWFLDYLVGKDIIFGYGPRDLASYVTIQSYTVVDSPGNTLKITFDITFLGHVRGHFRDASDPRCVGGTLVTDTSATLDTAAKLSGHMDMRHFTINQNAVVLPTGNYRMFARVRDTTQVSKDVFLGVYAASATVASWTKTVTSGYRVYMIDFTIGSAHVGKDITFQVRKNTATANNIYVDYIGIVAVP